MVCKVPDHDYLTLFLIFLGGFYKEHHVDLGPVTLRWEVFLQRIFFCAWQYNVCRYCQQYQYHVRYFYRECCRSKEGLWYIWVYLLQVIIMLSVMLIIIMLSVMLIFIMMSMMLILVLSQLILNTKLFFRLHNLLWPTTLAPSQSRGDLLSSSSSSRGSWPTWALCQWWWCSALTERRSWAVDAVHSALTAPRRTLQVFDQHLNFYFNLIKKWVSIWPNKILSIWLNMTVNFIKYDFQFDQIWFSIWVNMIFNLTQYDFQFDQIWLNFYQLWFNLYQIGFSTWNYRVWTRTGLHRHNSQVNENL